MSELDIQGCNSLFITTLSFIVSMYLVISVGFIPFLSFIFLVLNLRNYFAHGEKRFAHGQTSSTVPVGPKGLI
jgi:hypothetical protein